MNNSIKIAINAKDQSRFSIHNFESCLGPNLDIVSLDNDQEYDLMVIAEGANSSITLRAFALGIPVFRKGDLQSDTDKSDLIIGYFNNPDVEWYAKIFSDPVIVANANNLTMHLGSTINPRAIILNGGLEGNGGRVILGRGSHIGADCLLNLGPTDFSVGNFSMISANFSAHAMRHTTNHISNFSIQKGPFAFFGEIYEDASDIQIFHDVWIGERVTCLPGVKLATGSVVGAGSVVTRSTEPYGVYVGNPARLLRFRFDDKKREFLLKSEWWNWSFEKLKLLQSVFKKDIQKMSLNELEEIMNVGLHTG